MKSPKVPEPTPGANMPQNPRYNPGTTRAMTSNPMARMFAPLMSGSQAQRAGRRSLIGGAGV